MRGESLTRCFVVALLVALAASFAFAAPASAAGEPDVRALLQQAGEVYDLDAEDAVFLLDSVREDWTADGRQVHTVHRMVFIRTGLAIRRLADLRVPYDHERQRFVVDALRTWRLSDERWIESGPTARVETLPFALERAPDYGGWREMMLLHDGVELPCVLETAYTIEDVEPFRAGADGLWLFPRSGPALLSRFVLGFPAGAEPDWAVAAGAPEPRRERDEAAGLETLTFEMGPIDPAPYPPPPGPFDAGPRVAWSTWQNWRELSAALRERFDAAAQADEELEKRFAEHLKEARTESEEASLVADFVAETTRVVDYETGWWPAPRDAARTWSTAYATAPDRTALAAALFRQAGMQYTLGFRGSAPGKVDLSVAGLSWAEGPGLWIVGEEIQGWFDPVSASWSHGLVSHQGYPFWRLGLDPGPHVLQKVISESRNRIRFDLRHDDAEAKWSGTGVLDANGVFCPFNRMSGLGTEAIDYLQQVVDEVLPGAKIGGFNPERFNRSFLSVGFEIELPAGERDGQGRLRFEVGGAGAVAELLERAAIHVHEETRGSVVRLPTLVEARIELHLDPGGLAPVFVPRPRKIENGAGRFELEAGEGEEGISLIRSLTLSKDLYEPGEWPSLRLLLLADGAEGNRLLLLE